MKKGDVIKVSGDIEFDEYSVKVDTEAVLLEDLQSDGQTMVTLTEIDGDFGVNVYIDNDMLLDNWLKPRF